MKENKHTYQFICQKCGKTYELQLTEKQYLTGKHSYKKYCSKSCANSHTISDITKSKISKSVKESPIYQQKILDRKKNSKNYIYDEITNSYIAITKPIYCGTIELNELYPEISKRQSPKWFNKLIPFGLNIGLLGTTAFPEEYFKCKQLLYTEYVLNKLSPKDIYKKYNCSQYFNNFETLLHIFKEWGFETRNRSEAIINSYLNNNLTPPSGPQYKSGWHTTWNGKEIYYRSSYELDYAKYLDEQNIDYEVESLRIKYFDSQSKDYRCAIPDFYIPSTNEIIEIKGMYTLDVQNLKDKFERYKQLGYKPKLILEHKEVDLDEL